MQVSIPLGQTLKGIKQLGASAVEYALALAVITTVVMAGGKMMSVTLETAMNNVGQTIKSLAGDGGSSNGSDSSNPDTANNPPDDQVAIAPWVVPVVVNGVRVLVKFTARQLQKKYKHAKDFGIKGDYSKANAAKYRNALENPFERPQHSPKRHLA